MMETETDSETLGNESVLTQLVVQKIPTLQTVPCRFISQFILDIQSSLSVLRPHRLEEREKF